MRQNIVGARNDMGRFLSMMRQMRRCGRFTSSIGGNARVPAEICHNGVDCRAVQADRRLTSVMDLFSFNNERIKTTIRRGICMTGNHSFEYKFLKIMIPRYMMEITTGIGCVVNCKFCPQKTFLKSYKGKKRKLSFEDFKIALDKMPKSTIIIFSGFAEPFLNADCTKMILHASRDGHPVSIFTTGTGMSVEDVEAIKGIPFSGFPHGGFVLHLADDEGYANIKVDDKYLKLLEAIKEANIHNLLLRTMGALHKDVGQIFSPESVMKQKMNSRAGYLTKEGVEVGCSSCVHDGDVMCGRDEYIYNNVMLPNGDVVLCCQDFGMKHILGNLLDESYEKISPDPLSCYELCKSCHYAIDLPMNFPKFQFKKE